MEWEKLLKVAQDEVCGIVAKLPGDLRQAASDVPVTYDPRSDDELRDDNLEDTLGLFVGGPMSVPEEADLPAQIILFLWNIWDAADQQWAEYRRQIRTTYLHELGHFLGLGELDLEERGLD